MPHGIWTTRLVVVLGVTLLLGSVLSAVAQSSITPWSLPAPQRVQPAAQRVAAPARDAALLAGAALFKDDFSDDRVGANPPAGWTIADGHWDGVVNDGGHVLRHGVGAYGHVVTGSTAWTDYTVGAALRPTALTTGFAGVVARYEGRGDYYACGVYYASALRLWRVRGGAVTLLDARSALVDTRRFHDVRLVVTGSRLSCVLDGSVLLSAVDGSFPAGRVGLVAGAGEAAEFADISVVG
jgi:pectate lyase